MHGFFITDPAAVIADRERVQLDSEQAQALRHLVAQVEADVKAEAEHWGLDYHKVAAARLRELRARRGITSPIEPIGSQEHEIIETRIGFACADGKSGSP